MAQSTNHAATQTATTPVTKVTIKKVLNTPYIKIKGLDKEKLVKALAITKVSNLSVTDTENNELFRLETTESGESSLSKYGLVINTVIEEAPNTITVLVDPSVDDHALVSVAYNLNRFTEAINDNAAKYDEVASTLITTED